MQDSDKVHSSSAVADSSLPSSTRIHPFQRLLEVYFEKGLWSSRYAILSAVIACVVVAIAIFYIATVDTVLHLRDIGQYASANMPPEKHEALRTLTISHVVEAIDAYLLAAVMLIFGYGLYELFISRVDPIKAEDRPKILLIHNIDDLKQRLGQVVLLILIVKFFEIALGMTIKTTTDILFLAVGILLIAASLQLSHLFPGKSHEPGPHS